jgi:hypothetical protein
LFFLSTPFSQLPNIFLILVEGDVLKWSEQLSK